MTGDELREKFLLFFEQKGHKRIASSSLIPLGDPTLLLTSAGMVQFKPYFTGEAAPPSPRLTSCQKCFRTTDIESVGDLKHLTFFEMLGNFSVGDYFKKEAIAWAWEFVTDWLKIPGDRLWITIFLDDDESLRHWRCVGVPAERIVRWGEKDNFWGPAGETGPCGPCSEIHYDFGREFACGPGCSPSCDCGRFLEIWNLVFTEYYQDAGGKRTPLPRKNIDTGMGLERTAAVLQGTRSPYETDLFAPIVKRVSDLTGHTYGKDEKTDRAMRIVAEHARAVTFLIADGVAPANDGRGYVLRRVLRRAALFGRTLGLEEPFLAQVAGEVVSLMGHVYPEIVGRRRQTERMIREEEHRFDRTAGKGLGILTGMVNYRTRHGGAVGELTEFAHARQPASENAAAILERYGFVAYDPNSPPLERIGEEMAAESISELYYQALRSQEGGESEDGEDVQDAEEAFAALERWPRAVSGREAFVLYDTYGFPVELTAEIVAQSGLLVGLERFKTEMGRQRDRARAAHRFVLGEKAAAFDYASMSLPATEFVGYARASCKAKVIALVVEGKSRDDVAEGEQVEVVLDRTPFYGEMGGQVGDTGDIAAKRGKIAVSDTVWGSARVIVHRGKVVQGRVRVGEDVTAAVDTARRLDIARNHTSTHLLHAALRRVLGSHVRQMGSLVAPERFRFDFSSEVPVLEEELAQIQRIVNENIRQNLPVTKSEMPHAQAVAEGAIALFGEKYGDVVRVVRVGGRKGPVSFEVCGGIHVSRTGDIGFFHIVSEGSIGSGMRRIEAVTGRGAEELIEERVSRLDRIAHQLQVPAAEAEGKLGSILGELDSERKRAAALERRLSRETAESLLAQVESVDGVSVLAVSVPASNVETLRHTGDVLRERLGSAVIVLGAVWADRPNFLAMVTPDLVARGLNAGDIARRVAQETGGSGGGRPQLGQGGGKDKDKLEQALELVAGLVRERV